MSSINKTDYLGLNSWAGTDKPERADFNSDNDIIDAAFSQHFEDAEVHITADERETWNTPYYLGMYIGNGDTLRTITTNCPFQASAAVVFCTETGPVAVDFENETTYNYFAVSTKSGGMDGVILSGADIIVTQNASGGEYGCASFNMSGNIYTYMLFR
ncbi:MAG: hypothetical protein LUH82_05165 [Clostridiales bacterium]|nr:hypothetical protein [Clostridiales bacterium]